MKYVAKEGYVYDWKDLTKHTHKDEKTGKIIQTHLYAHSLWINYHCAEMMPPPA